MKKNIIGGVFRNQEEAVPAIEGLHDLGYTKEEISVFAKDSDDVDGIEHATSEDVTKQSSGRGKNAGKGFGIGAGTGGVLGGIGGIIAEIGLLTIPGVGLLAATGPIATALSGAAIGAGGGGLVGALTGAGIPEEHAKEYEKYLDNGNIIVLVEADATREETVYNHFTRANSLNTHTYPEYLQTRR
ncbi:general stress protein [Bacillus suaedae]|uniref:General stress protein n=1 Tax=Halalkalibacter suaedae TaxID=2822140 RepID=A0A941AM68_9BACI|nr:general stress protein [Bacillus suaedae]MBP3950170.1 general stress protein [Bacillus suaedae]